jgi:hypothetical protein
MRIAKPVLRLSFADVLPPLVVRHRQSPWLSVPHQEYCLHAAPYLLQLLGKPTSQLVQRGILDPTQLQKFFTDGRLGESASRDVRIRSYYNGVIACAMTELFLRQFDPDQSPNDALAK